jgi:hypothetical protein
MAGLDPGVIEAVINSNFKTLAEQVASNTANHQHRLQLIAESSVGQIVNRMNSLDPAEAIAIGNVARADLSKEVAALSAAVSSIQQLIKAAQTTPPPTGT